MPTTIDYAEMSRRVTDALRVGFGPNLTVRTDEGWMGRIHAKVVGTAFDGRTEDEKQAMVWEVLRRELKADADAVSLVLVYGIDEI